MVRRQSDIIYLQTVGQMPDLTGMPHEVSTYANSVILLLIAYRIFISDALTPRREHDELARHVKQLDKKLEHLSLQLSMMSERFGIDGGEAQ